MCINQEIEIKHLEASGLPCVCEQGDQTTDHLIYNCPLLETQRRILREKVIKDGQWPAGKQELTSKHLEAFTAFIESIDFECL